MNKRLLRWFPLAMYTDPVLRQRAVSTYLVAVLLMIVAPIIYAPITYTTLTDPKSKAWEFFSLIASAIVLYIACIAAIRYTRRGKQAVGGRLLLAVWSLLIFFAIFNVGYPISRIGLLAVPLIWTGISLTILLTDWDKLPYAVGLGALGIIAFSVVTLPPNAGLFDHVFPLCAVLLAGFAIHCGLNVILARGISESAQRANVDAAKRLNLVEASSGVIQRILTRSELNALVKEVVVLVCENFDQIDEVQLWLVEPDKRTTRLVATTGAESNLNHQIGVGTLNPIGRVTLAGQHILVRDLPGEQGSRRNALPTGFRSELVLPLKVATEVIGVLDIASKQLDAFMDDDIEVLQALSDQIAIAIDNTRLYSAAQASLSENRRLYEQTRTSLREIERLNQQLTGQSWNEYLRERHADSAFTFDFSSGTVEPYSDWSPTLEEAVKTLAPATQNDARGKTLAFPIVVRGQVVGAVEYELDSDQVVSPEQMETIRQALERLGFSADNARLFDESQRIAQREALVNDISERMQGSTNVDAALSAAAMGLASALKTSRVAIRLGSAER